MVEGTYTDLYYLCRLAWTMLGFCSCGWKAWDNVWVCEENSLYHWLVIIFMMTIIWPGQQPVTSKLSGVMWGFLSSPCAIFLPPMGSGWATGNCYGAWDRWVEGDWVRFTIPWNSVAWFKCLFMVKANQKKTVADLSDRELLGRVKHKSRFSCSNFLTKCKNMNIN